MLDRFKEVIDAEFPYLKNGKVFLAISGGKDSMVLLDLLMKINIQPILLHCNFQLRGDESDRDEDFLSNYAFNHDLQIEIRKFDTEKFSKERKKNIQETARELRYEWFASFIGNENTWLLTAHHLDDSIETFFINLLRGTGLKGLGGIPVKNKQVIRPLYRFTTEDIYQYIDANNIDYRKDSSNSGNKYLRNQLRNNFLPQLLELEPQLKSKMRKTLAEISKTNAWIKTEVEAKKEEIIEKTANGWSIDLEKLKVEPSLMIVRILSDFGFHRSQIPAFTSFVKSETGAHFNCGNFTFLLDRDKLLVEETDQIKGMVNIEIFELPFGYATELGRIDFELRTDFEIDKSGTIQQVDAQNLQFPLKLRNWQQGDKIVPFGMFGHKLISDILIDKKVNQFDKDNKLVLVNGDNRIILLSGMVVSEEFKITEKTTEILEVSPLF